MPQKAVMHNKSYDSYTCIRLSPTERFLKEVESLSVLKDKVSLTMTELASGTVMIDDIRSKRPGQGWGTIAMRDIVHLADLNRITLTLGIIDNDQTMFRLIAWYKKLGFHLINNPYTDDPEDGIYMERKPRKLQ